MCGASKEQKEGYGNVKSLGNMLRGAFQTIFAKNQGILDHLEASLDPQVRGGPSAYGFSAGEDGAGSFIAVVLGGLPAEACVEPILAGDWGLA